MSGRARTCCITWNNCPEDIASFGNLDTYFFSFFEDTLNYGVYQVERGDENEKLHVQAYLEFKKPMRYSAIQKMCPGVHIEKRRGTRSEAREYCQKVETRVVGPYEYGEWSEKGQGRRTDYEAIKKRLDEGASEKNIAEEHFGTYLRVHRGIGKYIKLCSKPRDWNTELIVHVGEPGTGKTTSVKEKFPNAYWKDSTQWWDCYAGQEVVVIDEMFGGIPYHMLLRLCDSTPMPVEYKGEFTQFVAKTIITCSNKAPHEWYDFDGKRLVWNALKRRISMIYYHHKNQPEPSLYLDYDDFMEDWIKGKNPGYLMGRQMTAYERKRETCEDVGDELHSTR